MHTRIPPTEKRMYIFVSITLYINSRLSLIAGKCQLFYEKKMTRGNFF